MHAGLTPKYDYFIQLICLYPTKYNARAKIKVFSTFPLINLQW